MGQENLNKTFNEVKSILSVTNASSATAILKNTDSGKVVLVDASTAATNLTIALPVAEEGLTFKFVLSATSAADSEILVDAGAGSTINIFAGGAVTNQKVGFPDSTVVGTLMEITCDGTNWYGIAMTAATINSGFS